MNPSWQRAGLGRAAVERLISILAEEDISIITLYAEPKVVGLYEKLGAAAWDPEPPAPTEGCRTESGG